MNTCILISSQDITPADLLEIHKAFNALRNDLQFVILEQCPASKVRLKDIAYTQALLNRVRRGMHALLLRHQALRTAVQRYVDEWTDNLPKGWGHDELLQSLHLEREIPDDSICIDPCGCGQHREDLEDWVIDLGRNGLPKDHDALQKMLNSAYRKGNQDAHQAAGLVTTALSKTTLEDIACRC